MGVGGAPPGPRDAALLQPQQGFMHQREGEQVFVSHSLLKVIDTGYIGRDCFRREALEIEVGYKTSDQSRIEWELDRKCEIGTEV